MNAILTALLIPLLGTTLGATFVFFMKKAMPDLLQKILLGFASGVMVAASVWSMPLRAAGNSRWKSFWVGALSGIVEPLGGALVILLAAAITPMMPYLLAFAAGAMLYVVVEELVPEASQGEHSNIATVGFAIGFALMMVLDVVMG